MGKRKRNSGEIYSGKTIEHIDEATTENVEQWWEEIAEQIQKCGEELSGRSTGKKKTGLESWLWNDESAVTETEGRRKIWKRTGEENDMAYMGHYSEVKGKYRVVARVKAETYRRTVRSTGNC